VKPCSARLAFFASIMLGSTTAAEGLPVDVLSSGDARWLGVQPAGQPEQARVMLLSVPYALKAGDVQTLGGLPASAFMLSVPTAQTSAIPR
jgi:trimeric autotransporter adhesin